MSNDTKPPENNLNDPDEKQVVGDVAKRFEAAWRAGLKPTIEAFLVQVRGELRTSLVVALIKVELELRSQAGDQPLIKEYLARFPQFRSAVRQAFIGAESMVQAADQESSTTVDYREGQDKDSPVSPSRMPHARNGLHVRCPHCRNPIEIVETDSLQQLACPSCGSSISLLGVDSAISRAQPAVKRLGHFELVQQLGMGAFGTVWKARDTELDRIVAIKIPRHDRLRPDEAEMFFREARAAAQLRHPSIVSVHEVGRDGDTVYIVSDFVRGMTLSDWLSGQQPTPREAAELSAQIGDALHHAHEQGVIHRDLKPSNIMLDAESRVHIMDFGLAKREAGEITMTVEGQVLGTPAYMSPEQARGEGHAVDRRTDIYSLGVILYQLLTGELPFRGNQRMLLHQVLYDEPRAPRSLNDRVPRDLETICLKAMSKAADKRYKSTAALADDLRRFRANEPILARPVGRIERGWRWCRRNRAIAAAAATIVSLLMVVATVSTTSAIRVNAERQRADRKAAEALAAADEAIRQEHRANQKTNEALEIAEALSQQKESLRRSVYDNHLMIAQRAWDAGNIGQVHYLLRQSTPQKNETDLRGWEWWYQRRLCEPELRTIAAHTDEVNCVTFSRDGRYLFSACSNQPVKQWDAETGVEIRAYSAESGHEVGIAFSADGRRFVSAVFESICLWDAKTGARIRDFQIFGGGGVTTITISGDGRRIASGNGVSSVVRLWDAENGEQVREMRGHTGSINCVQFSSDGSQLASASDDESIKLWDTESGAELRTFKGHAGSVRSIAFSPDNQRLASTSYDDLIKLWNVKTGTELRSLSGHTAFVHCVCFGPDGHRLASASDDGSVILWDADTGDALRAFRATREFLSVAFSPEGSRIAACSRDGTITLWSTESKKEMPQFRGHAGEVHAVSFSLDGRRIACGDTAGVIQVWDSESGAQVNCLKQKQSIDKVAFSHDGQIMAATTGDSTVKLFDADTGADLHTFEGLAFRGNVTFSPDSRCIAFALVDQSVKLHDTHTGAVLLTLREDNGQSIHVAFLPDGRRLATVCENGTIRLWGTEAGEQLRSFRVPAPIVAAISPNGGQLASSGIDGTVTLCDIETGTVLRTFQGHTGEVNSFAFSADGRRLATSGQDQTLRIWNTESGAELHTLQATTSQFNSIAFSPDGFCLVSGNTDDTVHVWDATSISHDEKMARSLVRQFYDELNDPGQVAKVIAQRDNWPVAMREAARTYLDHLTPKELNAE